METGTGVPELIRKIEKPKRRPGEPEVFPSVENPPEASGTLIEHVVGTAKRDLKGASDADIAAALANIEDVARATAPLSEQVAGEAAVPMARARAIGEMAAGALHDVRELEQFYREEHGIDLAHPEKNPWHKRLLLGWLKLTGEYDEEYDWVKEEVARDSRSYRKTVLAHDAPETHAAIAENERGLKALKAEIKRTYGLSPDEYEHSEKEAARFTSLLQDDEKFHALMRRYRVAEQDLDRMREKYDIPES